MSISNGSFNSLYSLELLRPDVCDADYRTLQLGARIHTLETTSLHTYKTYLVFDFYKKEFVYVSSNPLFLFQNSAENVKKEGITFYQNRLVDGEREFLCKLFRATAHFLEFQVLPEERSKYTLSYNVRVLDSQKRKLLLNNKISFMEVTPTGKIWLALCSVSLASSQNEDIAFIQNTVSGKYWEYNTFNETWKEFAVSELSECERLTIHLSRQGYSVSDIAARLARSEDAIKKYRKDLFAKLDVNNIAEAIALAVDMRLV